MKKLVFFGTQDWAARLLERLIQDGFFEIVLVVTQPDQEVGRKKIQTPPPVKQTALQYGLPVIQPTKLRDAELIDRLKKIDADLALLIAYGRMLPQEILSLYPLGTINVHPSLLPRWRGPSPVQAAIASGDHISGVTIIKIDAQMDHGPLLAQRKIPLNVKETFETFMEKVIDVSGDLLPNTLKGYIEGSIVPHEQNHTEATTCKLLKRDDGRIDWKRSAVEIDRLIRAYHPWPGAWSELTFHQMRPLKNGDLSSHGRPSTPLNVGFPTSRVARQPVQRNLSVFQRSQKLFRLKFIRAQISDTTSASAPGTIFGSENRLFIATGNGALEITLLQPEGKAPMPAPAFLSGYGEALGAILE